MRVYELARDLGVSSKAVQLTARRMGLKVKSPSSDLPPILAEVLAPVVLADVERKSFT